MKIKSLECIKHWQNNNATFYPMANPRCVYSKHVWMCHAEVDLTDDKFLTNECNPGMQILTIEKKIICVTANDDESVNDTNITNRGLQIKTMRILRHWSWRNLDICNEKIVIDSLNLHNSLKNLTIECVTLQPDNYGHQQKALTNILEKEYYYNLENVNIIIEINQDMDVFMTWFFQLLEKNVKNLKYQFKQLNIATLKKVEYPTYLAKESYFVLEWNDAMDNKRLNQVKKQLDEMKSDDENQKQYKEKYWSMKTQWFN